MGLSLQIQPEDGSVLGVVSGVVVVSDTARGKYRVRSSQLPQHAGQDRTQVIIITSRVPVEGKSSVCAKMILIIIIISLGKILLSYILQTHHACMHAHTRAHEHLHPPPSLFTVSVRPTMTESWLGASF